MSASSAKSNILKKIKMALEQPTPLPFSDSQGNESLFQPLQEDLMVEFAEQFTILQGKFDYCLSEGELLMHFQKLCLQQQWAKIFCEEEKLRGILPGIQWHNDIMTCDVAITSCELLVARTGSMVLSSSLNQRIPSVYAPVHICIAYASQLVYDIKDALDYLEQKYHQKFPSSISLATGPSRTADIEKTLVVGVHGPKEVYCFLVER
jgi:L-lactate dehydrogenase complex protein LldG